MEPFDRFLYAMQKAAGSLSVSIGNEIGDKLQTAGSVSPISDFVDDITGKRLRDDAYFATKPFINALYDVIPGSENQKPVSYSAGYALGKLLKPPVYNPNDLGPYENAVNYLKKTEESELLLREARNLRRRARLIQKQREQENQLKRHVENSRYF